MRTARWGAALLAAAVVCAAPAARAQEADKDKGKETAASLEGEPELHYPPPSTRWKVLGAGVFITGGAWSVGFAMAQAYPYVPLSLQPTMPTTQRPIIVSGPPEGPMLRYPIVGPWLAISKMGCASDEIASAIPGQTQWGICGVKMGFRSVAYVLDGLIQLGGLALIAEGIVMKTESAPAPKPSALSLRRIGLDVTPVPVVSSGFTGMTLVGTF